MRARERPAVDLSGPSRSTSRDGIAELDTTKFPIEREVDAREAGEGAAVRQLCFRLAILALMQF